MREPIYQLISCLELARESLARKREADRLPASVALASGERLSLEEVAFRASLDKEEAGCQFARLVELGEAFNAICFDRRCEVFWRRW